MSICLALLGFILIRRSNNLNALIRNGEIVNVLIDASTGRLFCLGEKAKTLVVLTCQSCGGTSKVLEGEYGVCQYLRHGFKWKKYIKTVSF